jgi:hypothetical protein
MEKIKVTYVVRVEVEKDKDCYVGFADLLPPSGADGIETSGIKRIGSGRLFYTHEEAAADALGAISYRIARGRD